MIPSSAASTTSATARTAARRATWASKEIGCCLLLELLISVSLKSILFHLVEHISYRTENESDLFFSTLVASLDPSSLDSVSISMITFLGECALVGDEDASESINRKGTDPIQESYLLRLFLLLLPIPTNSSSINRQNLSFLYLLP